RCAGRVEVKQQGQWGTVCGYLWDMADAEVVCKELDCGSAVRTPEYGNFGPGSGPIWMHGVECHGNESALSDCTNFGSAEQYCDHNQDAGVTCSAPEGERARVLSLSHVPLSPGFRLVNGSTACDGRVEVQVLGTWGTLCASRWDLLDAHVLCRQLECG
ncbi:DMBT1 protein, partial [Psophia crepitans]|nr:DMBT1 protein [Psophia crepitans]